MLFIKVSQEQKHYGNCGVFLCFLGSWMWVWTQTNNFSA